ncbi:MAG: DUF4349 domain-containing protein, partial [Flavobacteriaceae bacterium]|nr:DUF4349 domain-containing protein [Flavobacteriaceae bacterium]
MKFFSLLFFGLALACSSNSSKETSYSPDLNVGDEMEEYVLEEVAETNLAYNQSRPKQQVEQQIIKTAQLEFSSEDLAKTQQQIMGLVTQYQGFVQNDESGKNYNQFFRRVTVRVPSQNFQPFIDGVSEGVSYFD